MYRNPIISGFTTNPTLMHKAGITDYEAFAKDIVSAVQDRPISFEVFADEFDEMERQALQICRWGNNVYTKIPVTNTRRESSLDLVCRLARKGVKLNVTALMTLDQVQDVSAALAGGPPAYVSVFAGRIADTGRDPVPLMAAAVELLRPHPNIELIWASPPRAAEYLPGGFSGLSHHLLRPTIFCSEIGPGGQGICIATTRLKLYRCFIATPPRQALRCECREELRLKSYQEELPDVTRYINNNSHLSLDDHEEEFQKYLRVIRRCHAVDASTRMLEIGTGTGWFPLLCKRHGLSCKGLEISPQLIDYARQFGRRHGIEAEIELGQCGRHGFGQPGLRCDPGAIRLRAHPALGARRRKNSSGSEAGRAVRLLVDQQVLFHLR